MSMRVRTAILAFILVLGGLAAGSALKVPGVSEFVSSAEAIIGRPLTPVSIAGVGRRTVRRCAVGVYHC